MLVAPNVIPDMVAAVEHVTSRGVGSLLLGTLLVSFLVSVMMLTASRMFSVNSLPTLLLVLIDSLSIQLSFLMSPCVLSKDDFFEHSGSVSVGIVELFEYQSLEEDGFSQHLMNCFIEVIFQLVTSSVPHDIYFVQATYNIILKRPLSALRRYACLFLFEAVELS